MIAEDTYEKLRLLDFNKHFCQIYGFKFDKYYFTLENKNKDLNGESQFSRYFQIIAWFHYLIKNVSFIIKKIVLGKNALDNKHQSELTKLFQREKKEKLVIIIKIIEDILNLKLDSSEKLIGHGDWCVVILSHIIDFYLEKIINFTFKKVSFKGLQKEEVNKQQNQFDFNTSIGKKEGKLKFNKTKIMEKLDRLDFKKLENDYIYFFEKVNDCKKINVRNSFCTNITKNTKETSATRTSLQSQYQSYNNSFFSSINGIKVAESKNFSSELDLETRNIFDKFYDNFHDDEPANSIKKIKNIISTLKNEQNDLELKNQNLIPALNKISYNISKNLNEISSLENRNFNSGNDKDYGCIQKEISKQQSKVKDLNCILIEKKQVVKNKEIKLIEINNSIETLNASSKINEEKIQKPFKIIAQDQIIQLKKEITHIEIKNRIYDIKIKSLLREGIITKKQKFQNNKFSVSLGSSINYNEVNEFDEVL